MVLLIDNYDSFSYNLYQYIGEIEPDIKVIRNDELTVDEIRAMSPDRIILSPGPGRPENAGIMLDLIQSAVENRIPLLGVCLGHQGIGEAFGASVIQAKEIMHGKISSIEHVGKGLFAGFCGKFNAVRYHSLALDENTIPPEFEVTCRTSDGEVMGIRHKSLIVEGIQYHPESILTSAGKRQMSNFISMVRGAAR